jgi:hypothetical protein
MSEIPKRERKSATIEGLPLLIHLFYGFAIANGLSDALKSTIEKQSLFQWLFLVAAFLLGLGDWLAYHMHVSHVFYRSVSRLLMDLLFPALVYCLLLAPTLAPTAAGVSYVAWIVFIYFAFSITYAVLLRREDPHLDQLLIYIILVSLVLSAGALLLNYLLPTSIWQTVICHVLATGAVGLWAAYNLRLVYRIMHSDDPRNMA